MQRRRPLATVAVIASAAVATGVATTAQAGPAKPTFGTPVVASHYFPGFEPDVAIDKSPRTGGTLYTTWPNGFSTTISYAARSDDGGRSFHLVEGNLAGKTTTCIGGGDSEIQVSPVDGSLYFADLQGLVNFSNSRSTDQGRHWTTTCTAVPTPGVDRQWLAIDTNGGKSTVNGSASGARVYFTYDNIVQNPNGNTLVMNESVDGVNFGSGCTTAGVPCLLPPAVVTETEGLPGNTLVDNTPGGKYQHTVYVIHQNSSQDAAVVSYCRGPASGKKTAATVADACTKPEPGPTTPNPLWRDTFPRKSGAPVAVEAFPVMAIDTKGNLYAAWTEYPVASGSISGPGVVKYSYSTDGAKHWAKPQRVSPKSLPTNIFPWISAGDPGRIDIAYYAAPQKSEDGVYGPDALTKTGTWNVYLDQSLNALSSSATFTHATVSDHQVKWGNISTQGLAVGGTASDRSLGDYLQVQTGVHGEAVLSYVDDTSQNRNPDFTFGSGESPPQAAGPTIIARQTGGPSLYKSVGTLDGSARRPYGKVGDPSGKGFPDAYLGLLGDDTDAPKALDIAGVTITQSDSKHLRITMTTADKNLADDLGFPVTLGGTTGDWIVRWAAPSYDKANGNGGYLGDGDIFYVGMESTSGGAPSFFAGSTEAIQTTHAKYFAFTPQTDIPGSIKGSTITWTVPLSEVGSPPKGASLYSVTGFTQTQLLPTLKTIAKLPNDGAITDYTPPNLIDAAAPVTYTVGTLTPNVPGSTKPPTNENPGGTNNGPVPAATGLAVGVPLVALAFAGAAVVVLRRRRQLGDQLATK